VGEGFLKTRIDDMCDRFKYQFPFADHGEVFGPDDRISVHTIPGSEPLNQRAWTLQESLLPLLSIIFDSYRMTWKCNTEVQSDKRGIISTQGRHNLGSRHNPSVMMLDSSLFPSYNENYQRLGVKNERNRRHIDWYFIITHYGDKGLSYGSDKLPAISAIAEYYAAMLSGSYLADIWDTYLVDSVMWLIQKHVKPNL
jgi:hypothetical protein